MSEAARQSDSARALDEALAPRPMSDAQRRTIFGLGRRLGMGLDELRDLTPLGSLSALDGKQAAELIDRLKTGVRPENRPAPKKRPRRRRQTEDGVVAIPLVTPAQKTEIARLVVCELGWTAPGFDAWLRAKHSTACFEKLADGRRATKIIHSLRKIVEWRARRAAQAGPPHEGGG